MCLLHRDAQRLKQKQTVSPFPWKLLGIFFSDKFWSKATNGSILINLPGRKAMPFSAAWHAWKHDLCRGEITQAKWMRGYCRALHKGQIDPLLRPRQEMIHLTLESQQETMNLVWDEALPRPIVCTERETGYEHKLHNHGQRSSYVKHGKIHCQTWSKVFMLQMQQKI